MVVKTWAVYPITANNAPFNLANLFRFRTLPAKSPIWFGVIILKAIPDTTADADSLNVNCSYGFNNTIHFFTSNEIFRNIKAKAKKK